jgi:5-methylcytosine-specific restriction endonuclease McrA
MASKQWAAFMDEPEWKQKRSEILKRDGYSCRKCGSRGKHGNLRVHHIKYQPGLKPWEYADETLISLCKDCHTSLHRLENIKKVIIKRKKIADVIERRTKWKAMRKLDEEMSRGQPVYSRT